MNGYPRFGWVDILRFQQQKAKEEGKSRKQWMLEEMDRILEGRDEQEKAEIVSAISDAGENVNNETLNDEED